MGDQKAIEGGSGELPDGYEIERPLDVRDAHSKPQRTVQAAVKLRTRGASYPEIAELLGYSSPASARVAVEEALATMYAGEQDFKALRAMTSLRYEGLIKSLARKASSDTLEIEEDGKKKRVANEEHLAYVREMRSVLDSFSRLHGINAPQVSMLITPEAAQFDQAVRTLVEGHRAIADSPEADIFADDIEDADVVD